MQKSRRKPDWLKIRLPQNSKYADVYKIIQKYKLNTICTSGKCPNLGECWDRGTATFMILGDICTRACKFCSVKTGKPLPPDPNEPKNPAEPSIAVTMTTPSPMPTRPPSRERASDSARIRRIT